MAALAAAGFRQVIYSCRADHPEGLAGIQWWLDKYDLAQYVAQVTHLKPHADAYIDDRGVEFTGANWDGVLARIEVLTTKREYEPLPPKVYYFDDNLEVDKEKYDQARDRQLLLYGTVFEQTTTNGEAQAPTCHRLISPQRIQIAPA